MENDGTALIDIFNPLRKWESLCSWQRWVSEFRAAKQIHFIARRWMTGVKSLDNYDEKRIAWLKGVSPAATHCSQINLERLSCKQTNNCFGSLPFKKLTSKQNCNRCCCELCATNVFKLDNRLYRQKWDYIVSHLESILS